MTDDAGVGSNGRVTYTVKELLNEIRSSVAGIDAKLDNKADKIEVTTLTQRVDSQDKRLDTVDFFITALDKAKQSRTESHRFRVPLIISVVFSVVSPFIWYGVYHIH